MADWQANFSHDGAREEATETERLAAATIAHYQRNAGQFWQGTRDHDVSQNYQRFLAALPDRRLRILDLGCGPGRDLCYFRDLGHEAIGVDACAEFVGMAREHSGCQVWQQDFLSLDLPEAHFDGIFANASLFHVPLAELERVLCALQCALIDGGVLFSSNPRGDGEYWDGSRFGNYMQFAEYATMLEAAGLEVLEHYYRPPGKPLAEQPWLAVVSRANS
ncbi:MAG: SAM-dependent methyltransferase [Rhodothermales bacterium]|jgi:SAM-dependent methyltransferase